MRVWLQKQKKKEEKAATAVATPPVETTPAPAETSQADDAAEKPVESVEPNHAEDGDGTHTAVNEIGEADQRAESAVALQEEVGLKHPNSVVLQLCVFSSQTQCQAKFPKALVEMNTIVAACASDSRSWTHEFAQSLISTRTLLLYLKKSQSDVAALHHKQ